MLISILVQIYNSSFFFFIALQKISMQLYRSIKFVHWTKFWWSTCTEPIYNHVNYIRQYIFQTLNSVGRGPKPKLRLFLLSINSMQFQSLWEHLKSFVYFFFSHSNQTCEFLHDFWNSSTQAFSTHPCLEWQKVYHKRSSMQFQLLWYLGTLENFWFFSHSRPASFCKILKISSTQAFLFSDSSLPGVTQNEQ